jgi:predicted nucleic acid-binding protein
LIAFDTNILIYGQQGEADPRRRQAIDLIDSATLAGAIIPAQVLGEFLNVCIRRLRLPPRDAIEQTEEYARVFVCPLTELDDQIDAASLSANNQLQFFDALIISVAARAGAKILLSEDMHNGLRLAGLTILNPFDPANETTIAAALAGESS